jgi:hypothetical protein
MSRVNLASRPLLIVRRLAPTGFMKSSMTAIGFWQGATPWGLRLITRRGNDWSARFPLVVEAVNHLKVRSCLIDGEVVCCDQSIRLWYWCRPVPMAPVPSDSGFARACSYRPHAVTTARDQSTLGRAVAAIAAQHFPEHAGRFRVCHAGGFHNRRRQLVGAFSNREDRQSRYRWEYIRRHPLSHRRDNRASLVH